MPGDCELSQLQNTKAVLGGSFDPIHLGHLHIARQILARSPIQELLFVPCGNHNFKKGSIFLDYDNRYELIRQAISNESGLTLSSADQEGSGYTAHLMQRLRAENPDQDYVFVIGSDILPTLHKWYDYDWLKNNQKFLILPRPTFEIKHRYLYGIKAYTLDIELSPISSTQIRARISRGESIHGLVPEKLEQRICELYYRQMTAKEN